MEEILVAVENIGMKLNLLIANQAEMLTYSEFSHSHQQKSDFLSLNH